MYEESESERYRAKLKDEYEVFARNQDVYATLRKLVGFQMLLDTALDIFHCPPDELEMDELHEMEKLLKMAKNRYHAIVSMENQEDNISISSEEEELEQNPVEPEISWRTPRNIPEVSNNNMAQVIPHTSYQPNVMHQTIPHTSNQQNVNYQVIPHTSYQPNVMHQTIPHTSYQPNVNHQVIPHTSNQPNVMHQTIPHTSYQPNVMHQTIPHTSNQQNVNHQVIPHTSNQQQNNIAQINPHTSNQQNVNHQVIQHTGYQPNVMHQTIPPVMHQHNNMAQINPSVMHQHNNMAQINPPVMHQQNSMAQINPPVMHQQIINAQQNMNPQQNMPTPSNPWNNYPPNYGPSAYPASTIQNINVNPSSTIQNPSRFVTQSGYLFNTPQHLPNAQHNPQVPSTSRQMPPEKHEPRSYREYRSMKLQEEQRENERREKQRNEMLKKQEEEKQERERIKQRELEQSQNADKTEVISNYVIRKKQIDDYNKREAEEQAPSTSKQSESGKSSRFNGSFRKDSKKSVKWVDIETDKSLTSTDNGDNNMSNDTSCEDSGSVKCVKSADSSGSSKGENGKKPISKSKSAHLKAIEKLKKASEIETLFSVTSMDTNENNVVNNTNCDDNGSVKSAKSACSSSSSKKETQSENGKKSTSSSKTANSKANDKPKKTSKAETLLSVTSMDTSENEVSINARCEDSGSASSSSSSKNENQSGKGKKSTSKSSKTANPKENERPKNASKSEKPVSKDETSKSKKSDSNKKTDKNKDNDNEAIDKKDSMMGRLQVYHPKPIVYKLIKDTESFIKRKSVDDPIEDIRLAKRSKNGTDGENNVPTTSDCDIREQNTIDINIKEEQMSDDEYLDGKTDVSSNADNENVESATVQRMESDHIRIKCEPEEDLDLNETASTVENIDIKEEVMSEIDQDNSSVHSEKDEVNEAAENFLSLCENPEILQTITERFIDFSQFENDITQDAVQNNNNNSSKTQIDSQERCASWVEGIQNYDRNVDEEAEPDDYIVPYYPVRQLGAPEIVPKEEEF